MRCITQLVIILAFALPNQGHLSVSSSSPEGGSCLSWGGCTDEYDEPVSALQVMLQVQDRGKKQRLEPSPVSKPTAQASIQTREEKVSMDLKPILEDGLAFVQMEQEAAHHHATKRSPSVNERHGASPGVAVEGGPVMPAPLVTRESAAMAAPEAKPPDQAAIPQAASPLFTWLENASWSRVYAIRIAAIFVVLALALLVIRRKDGKSILKERRKQQEEALPANTTGPDSETLFKPPKLPGAAASFAIPFVSLANYCMDVVRFDIPEVSGDVMLRAVLSRLPPSGPWAKVEIFGGFATTPGASTLLASCSLAGSAADIERENVTGALQSWLDLLLHEKSQSYDTGDTSDEDTSSRASSSRASAAGVSKEESVHCEKHLDLSPHSLRRLEVTDGLGSLFGTLELTSDGHYCFRRQGELAFEIESHLNDHCIVVKKDGKHIGLATGVLRSGIAPECTPEQFLQVDILPEAKSKESVLMLLCMLTVMVLDASRMALD